jgi:hypothetical protein
MAKKKNGSITPIIVRAARLTFPLFFTRKNSGMPTAAAMEKQISCLLVRLKNIFVLTFPRSLGTDIYAAIVPP